ncbi:AcrB/AcrD/AcrF family protein [Sphingomonas changnyeongensis]|uniref:AcrB/AcrD/AcrF family protein n=1 Tax=Sphingomonas changnyeongensis TaxID=2698679 RepID=A0A7Z2S736_9SPHN|nr:efflux RND transporter permease subunit [Sphingomonas changnyeongensis]QHL89986.1 AcrB/AcrD/AcrF family protein [Sphingomonas changnyeongensis]
MSFRNISAWSIRNPVPPIVLFVALTLAGLVAFWRMDVNENPDISFPAVQVVVAQPGAAPTELETQVTQRVEAAVRGISGVDEISSYVSEGNSRTMVQFAIGTPVDRAFNDVNQAVSNIRGDLPEGILEPQVARIDIAGGPVTYYSAEAVDMTLEELSWYVDNTVAKQLLGIGGMAQVRRSGGVNREIRVILDPARMQAQGLTAAQVNLQLRQINLNAAGGRAQIAGSEQAVRVLGNAATAYQLGQTEISVGGGRRVRLADIATVRDSYAEQRSLAKMNGRQVLSFSIAKAKGASDVTIHDEAEKVLRELEKANPKVRFSILFTRTDYVKEQYKSSIWSMVEGAVLAVVVVFLFLRDFRATIISALAIPLSAIPAFWFMDLMGFTLNNLSLLALSLVSGVLVDDAIVEIENIVRHMRMGKSAYQASIDAADEIGLAVLATTMAIVAVFLPVALMPGISGQFFIQFGMTVVVAVLMSLGVARMITPMIAAYFLKAHGEVEHGGGWLMDRYMAILRWSLGHRWWTVGLAVASFAATIVAFATLPMQFQPTVDSDFSQVKIELPPGSTLAQTERVTDRAADLLSRQPEVAAAFADVNVGNGDIFITLKKGRERSSVEFERALQPQLAAIADARVSFQSQSGGFSGRDITIVIGGDDPVALNAQALKIVREMGQLSEVRAARIEGDMSRPEILIKPRLDLAADLGVTTSALSQAIRIATLGDIDQNVAKFSLSDRQIPIRVMLPEQARTNLSTIENLPVPTATGGSVPLKAVAEISFGAGPTEIRRYNQIRRVVIGADLAPGVINSQAMDKINKLPSYANLPQGIRRVTQGDAKWQAELVQNFVIAVISGVLLVFAVLVLLYRRVMPPFVNMGSLLLAPLGAAIALHIAGQPVSMPVFIGLLMLLGIVAKNSILLVDFALEEIGKGVPKDEAILDAGHKRAQPIVMTTVAMVAGMIPTALSLTGDGAWRAPMGVTVIGGLILSTLLTLIIVPAGFSLADDLERRLGRLLSRLLTFRPGDDGRRAAQPAE